MFVPCLLLCQKIVAHMYLLVLVYILCSRESLLSAPADGLGYASWHRRVALFCGCLSDGWSFVAFPRWLRPVYEKTSAAFRLRCLGVRRLSLCESAWLGSSQMEGPQGTVLALH